MAVSFLIRKNYSSLLDKFGRPLKPAFFTGREKFYECYNFLDEVVKTSKTSLYGSANLPSTKTSLLNTPITREWKDHAELEGKLGFKLRKEEYSRILDKLNDLTYYESRLPALLHLLNTFTKDQDLQEMQRKSSYQQEIDKNGVSFAEGQRKSAKARVWLRPSTEGLLVINGKLAHEYFPNAANIRFRAEVWRPFLSCNAFSQYNVYALVSGGGLGGQAEAIRHAIANALVKQNVSYLDELEGQNLLKTDYRRKERKKYGRHRARRSFQWCKR